MATSPPGSPVGPQPRPQSMPGQPSLDTALKPRPPSAMMRPPRSSSRLSQSSSRGAHRLSDDEPKTSVKVVVRVRPPLGPSDPGYDLIPQRFQKSMVQLTTATSLGVDYPQGRKIFIFDRVFDADTTQKGMWDYLQDSVDAFLHGYNVSILAYGQSGSGKSFTMGTSGPAQQLDPSAKGVIPRAATHLFESLAEAGQQPAHARHPAGLRSPTRYSVNGLNMVAAKGVPAGEKDWEVSVTYLEIYNEQPRDLLLPEATPMNERPTVQIREDAKGRILVEGLKSVPVTSIEDLMAVLNHGSTIRQTDATAINSKSSRSHAIFTINLRQTKAPATATGSGRDKRTSAAEPAANGDSLVTIESKLHFVDLAGSERLKNTGATGDRAKEGISINAGLASLGKVISQLSSRAGGGHVSYRDSKLTRILQDSLGGNAITYMVACITPAEFHLSETLNTVQYAQRARNIQSKPKIQHVNDEADKQAVIERLKSEVAFLRQQIRSAETGDRRPAGGSVTDRPHEREEELQTQLLDVRESHANLSQRHAKLVAELVQASEPGDDLHHRTAASAGDRLKRSQENQQQIESVVLEYEKTIQSLEANLQITRSSLAATESTLLERETKCAYIETMNQQLNARVQKLLERESNTEAYLHELEARLEDQSTGGEQHTAIIAELRKEMTRIRESETNAEDYICTLEERLAESDQDMEILQREVERLEQLVDRQRSLGKLDNLLYELDHVQKKATGPRDAAPSPPVNGLRHGHARPGAPDHPGPLATTAATPGGPDDADDADDGTALKDLESFDETAAAPATGDQLTPPKHQPGERDGQPSPAQQQFIAEKFESVSQELFDLKIDHEATVNELDLLAAKYQEALRTLAEMQDSFDESRHPPSRSVTSPEPQSLAESSLADIKDHDVPTAGRQRSTRSLSSELSLAGESAASVDPPEVTALPQNRTLPVHISSSGAHSPDVEHLQNRLAEHERSMKDVADKYSQLQIEHDDALKTVEKLRTEMRLHVNKEPSSPGGLSSPTMPGVIRRMTSNITSGVDRGQRSLVSLRTLLAEEFESRPESLEKAEAHLTASGHEMSSRAERISKLENEVKNVRKEMEVKTTIIAGLTRERTSMRAGTPVDLSMVSQMRDQLIQKETELKALHEGYGKREEALQAEIARLTTENKSRGASPDPAGDAETEEKLRTLRAELAAAEAKLTATSAELDSARTNIETLRSRHTSPVDPSAADDDGSLRRAVPADGSPGLNEDITQLKHDLASQMAANAAHVDKIAELTRSHTAATKDIAAHQKAIMSRNAEIDQHKTKIAQLESKIRDVGSGPDAHKQSLKSLHEAHANEIEEMKLSHAGILAGYDDKIDDLSASHQKDLKDLNVALEESKAALNQIINGAQLALGHPTSHEMVVNHIQDLIEEKESVSKARARLLEQNAGLERQLEGRQSLMELEESVEQAEKKLANYQETIRSLANEVGNHEETIRDKEKLIKKHEATIDAITSENQKRIQMIEELEQQLQNSYEQHHNRVSVIQNQGNQALVEAQHRISVLEKEVQRNSITGSEENGSRSNTMKSQHRPQSPGTNGAQRSDSLTSNLRKSASIASLPSPPPAIPLPPLPSLPGISLAQASNPSPPQSRHTSKEVAGTPLTNGSGATGPPPSSSTKDSNTIRRQSAIIEDQEGRLRTIEKHLQAEKQLTATLEEALVDLETQSNKLRVDAEGWKKKAWAMEEELSTMRKERRSQRLSVQAVEEEVKKRREAEAARAQLEERMRLLQVDGQGKKKKKNSAPLNCF